MKLRPELVLAAALLTGLIWLLLEGSSARGTDRGGPERGHGKAAELPSAELAGGRLVPPVEATAAPVKREEVRPEPAARAATPAPTSRGRLVDEATLEPIPEALVATSRLHDWTDAGGWFDTGDVLDELDDLLVVNLADNASSHEVPRARWTRLPNAWRVPLAIGPTYQLRFGEADVPNPEAWEARLQRKSGADDRWHRLRKGPPPYLRYDDPLRALGPGEEAWLEARSSDGLHAGRGPVTSLVGTHEVEIDCRARAVLRGRVVDENGVPWNDLSIDALQLSDDAEESLRTRTGIDGSYQFSAEAPGQMRLVFQPPSDTRTRELELAVPLGVTQAPDLVLERRPTGSLRGQLRCRTKDVVVRGSLRLRALDGSGYEAERSFSFGGRRLVAALSGGSRVAREVEPTDNQEFLFVGLPAGMFELSAFSEDGHACSPASLQVQAPAEGLTMFFENAVALQSYVLTLVDAESRAILERVLAEVRIAGAWWDRPARPGQGEALVTLPEGVGFEWRAIVPGYRMVRGSADDFRPEGRTRVATRAVQRGFGLRLRLMDRSEGPEGVGAGWIIRRGIEAVAGAEILADGELVATSDANGIADIELRGEPARIEVRLAGWRVLDSPSFRKGKAEYFPTSEVWMVRE